MHPIVAQQPTCRHCGSPVKRLRRCPGCGKRAWWWQLPWRGPGV